MRLSEESLDWALANVEAYGDTDIFPSAFEFLAIRHCWDDPNGIRTWLLNQDMFTWKTRAFRRCLSPKHRFGFRVSTQLDPLDTLVFSALTYELGNDIEARRVEKNLDVVHSYRFSPLPDGTMYDPNYSYESFMRKASEHAATGKYKAVVVADIADFFPRLYAHPFENALQDCTTNHRDQSTAIKKIINNWNYSISYGIPVGPTASRLLSEIAIVDVDEALLSENQTFCRYSDDYWLFCTDHIQARQRLAFLANTLFENHGLTLQTEKTRIVTIESFWGQYVGTERSEARASLSRRFQEILDELEIENQYEDIDYEDLEPHVQTQIDRLNLEGILHEQLKVADHINVPITRFVLRRLTQLDNANCIGLVVDEIEKLYLVFKDALEYLVSITGITEELRHNIGDKLLGLLDGSVVGHLEYHRCWILNTFAKNADWNQSDRFVGLLSSLPDEFSQRELVLSLGRARTQHWFKTRKRDIQGMGAWERRAFLAAASCLPGDEAKHWYQSVRPRLDELEKAVVRWAQANPFG